jgi:hypothetical protein
MIDRRRIAIEASQSQIVDMFGSPAIGSATC